MTAPSAFGVLLMAAAAATVGAASAYSRGRMALCGKQACFPPNECLDVGDGVSVCVRTDGPQCAGVQCATGYQCALLQDVCVSLPCHPKAYCVRSNPCGDCSAPDHFCQLLQTPVCRPVIQPTCQNKICAGGEICSEEQDFACPSPPCAPKLVCSAASDWYQVASGLTGSAGSGGVGGSGSKKSSKKQAGGGSSRSGDDEDDD